MRLSCSDSGSAHTDNGTLTRHVSCLFVSAAGYGVFIGWPLLVLLAASFVTRRQVLPARALRG